MSKWREIPLGKLSHRVTKGTTPTTVGGRFTDRGIAFVKVESITNDGRIVEDKLAHIDEETNNLLARSSLEKDDILFTIAGTIGRVGRVQDNILPANTNQAVAIVRPDQSIVESKYLYYSLRDDARIQRVHSRIVQSVQANFSLSELSAVEIPLPPLNEQREIAHVLGTLDDKIELNRRMNKTLEAMARELFKSWFVDFDPVRAKIAGLWRRGESLPGLPADLYDLFPDRLVDSELGEFPEGWRVGGLNDAIETLSGGTPKTSKEEYWDGDIPWYTAKDAPSLSDIFVLTTERSISQAGVDHSSTKVLPVGTTVITARGTVGRLACLGIPMAMNQTCYGLRGALGYPDYFTYWNVRNTVSDLLARAHGTIFDTITRETFKIAETVLAPLGAAEAFESASGSLMKRILYNLNESRDLATQRDALLPKLVSGEVRMGIGQIRLEDRLEK